MDLEIFKHEDKDDVICEESGRDHTQCTATKRLFAALKYYQHMNSNQSLFTEFMNDVYSTQCLDDFNHLVLHHGNDLEAMTQSVRDDTEFERCNDLMRCAYTQRHHRAIRRKRRGSAELNDCFYAQTMDSLHFWLFHQFDVGLRVQTEGAADDDADQHDDQETRSREHYDAKLSRFGREIAARTANSSSFERYGGGNKFEMKVERRDRRRMGLYIGLYLVFQLKTLTTQTLVARVWKHCSNI